MKLIIDTAAKTIQVEESVNLDELVKQVKKLMTDDWKEYKLIPSTTQPYTFYPITQPWIQWQTETDKAWPFDQCKGTCYDLLHQYPTVTNC